jgi:hypothetical protein
MRMVSTESMAAGKVSKWRRVSSAMPVAPKICMPMIAKMNMTTDMKITRLATCTRTRTHKHARHQDAYARSGCIRPGAGKHPADHFQIWQPEPRVSPFTCLTCSHSTPDFSPLFYRISSSPFPFTASRNTAFTSSSMSLPLTSHVFSTVLTRRASASALLPSGPMLFR